MKKALLVLLATGWFLCGFAQEIMFETKVHDFGLVNYNDPAICEFVFTNIGNDPLILQRPKSSCGCTIPLSWPKDPVLPGKKGTIKVEYKTNKSGEINRTVTVLSNAKSTPQVTLRVKGKVLEAGMGVKVITQNGKIGMENDKGQIIIPIEYEEIKNNNFGDFKLKKNGKWGAADRAGVVIPCEYDEGFNLAEIMPVKKGGKWGVIDNKNKIIIPFEYDGIGGCDSNSAKVQKNGKWGFVTKENKVTIPFGYYEDLKFDGNKGVLCAKKNGKWGLVDKNNKTITGFFAEEMFCNEKGDGFNTLVFLQIPARFEGKDVPKELANKWGAITTNGNFIIPPISDNVLLVMALASKKGYDKIDCNRLDSEKEMESNVDGLFLMNDALNKMLK